MSSTPPIVGPSAVKLRRRDDLPLREMDWLRGFLGGVRRGGIYLLGGAPGSRKSGLSLQIALDLARQGMRSLFLLSEESANRLYDRALPMMDEWSADEMCSGVACIATEELVTSSQLPAFIQTHILSLNPGFGLVVIDSIQGNSSLPGRHYPGIIQAARSLASVGITVLLVSHTTKDGRIAGPGAMEHAVDAVMMMKKTALGNALFVTKNRFGPSHLNDPLLMQLDEATLRLMPSKQTSSMVATARSYIGGRDCGLVDVQSSVSLAAHGTKGTLRAAGVPTVEVEQIIGAVSLLDGIAISGRDFNINVRIPVRRIYLEPMGLAMAMAIIGAYLQRPVPYTNVYLGEIDLAGAIHPADDGLVNLLAGEIQVGMEISEIKTLYLHPASAILLRPHTSMNVIACEHLKQVVFATWPKLR